MTGKLYGTLGPACANTDTLRALLRAGMRGVRLNLSHGPLEERAPWLESLRRAETAEGVSCDLLIDLQGPELRVGALFAPLTLREGDTLTLGEAFPVPPILTGNLQDGDELLLDDGTLSLRVLDARAMTCRVERGGVLRSRKSLAVAGRELPGNADANVRRPLGEVHVGLLRPQGHALDGALLGARLAEHVPGRRQYGHVRVAPDARHRHALQPVCSST